MRFSLLLALRYLRMTTPRSARLYILPFVLLVLVGLVYGADALARHSTSEHVLELHAKFSMWFGYGKWISWVTTVLVAVFILAIRRLTIFTTISTYGMFLGCAALILVLGVMSGFEADIKHKILGTHAHVEVSRLDEAFTGWQDKIPLVRAAPGVLAVTPVLTSEAMISAMGNRSTVIVRGIDPATVGEVSTLPRVLELGDLDALAHPEHIRPLPEPLTDPDDDPALRVDHVKDAAKAKLAPKEPEPAAPKQREAARRSPPGIILGRELAKTLRAYVGDDVSLISPSGGIGPTGAIPKARTYRVAGIFYTGMFEYDANLAYVTLESAQKLFDQPDEITQLDVKVRDPDHTDATVAAIGRALGRGYEAIDWKSLNGSLFSALALEKVVIFIILSFIILVAAFSIVANGHMIASQKIAEIAILKSMGATDGAIAAAFVLLGATLGVLGVLAGIAGGLFGAFALLHWGVALDPEVFYLVQLPVRLDPDEVAAVATAGILVTTLATVYPAYMAARMTPVEGLREGGR